MAPLVPIAISLATKYIPELIGKALDSKSAESVAASVIDIAKSATGLQDTSDALAAFKPTEQDIANMRKDILALLELQVGDVQHAREHGKYQELTTVVAYGIMFGNLALIAILIGLLVYVATSSLATSYASTLSAMIGGALNQLYQERQQVASFLFGSAVGSKLKDLLKR